MKKCPFCAEEIQDDAVKCRFCGSDITNGPGAHAAPAASKQVDIGNPRYGKKKILIGVIMLLVGIAFASASSNGAKTLGGFLIFVGLIVLIYGKIQHWYNNK